MIYSTPTIGCTDTAHESVAGSVVKKSTMRKNGKKIECRNCGIKFYVSKSRLNIKRYCSVDCGREDNFGLKPKDRKCVICGEGFKITNWNQWNMKTCSTNCRMEAIKMNSEKQREKNKLKQVTRKCRQCGKDVVSTAYCPRYFCGGKGNDCRRKHLSATRKGKNNPAYNHGNRMQTKKNYSKTVGKHMLACKKYKKEFIARNGYQFCEVCRVNQNGTPRFEVHHIYFASLYPKHPELHNPKNMVLVLSLIHI